MKHVEGYNNICEYLEINYKILDNCEQAKRKLQLELHYYRKQSLKSSSSTKRTSYLDADCIHAQGSVELRYDILEHIISEIQRFDNMIYIQEGIIESLTKSKLEFEEKFKKISGVKNKVFYLHNMMGLTLKQVAKELGYSEAWIKKINTENASNGN